MPAQKAEEEEKKAGDARNEEGEDLDKFGDDLMTKMMQEEAQSESNYVAEYNDVISEISKICSIIMATNKNVQNATPLNEYEVVELCPRITTLATEYRNLTSEDKERVFLETLLKGCFSLLVIKSPVIALKVSNSNIHCFFKIFDLVVQKDPLTESTTDFKKVFNYLYETVRGLLIYAKEGKFDKMFMDEGLIPQLCYVISKCFIEHGNPLLCDLLSTTVANKQVRNDEKVLDLLNYTIGTIKCFTQSNKEVQIESVNNKMVTLLSLTISKILEFNCSANRKAMILVQITGTLRNLANIDQCHHQLAQGAIGKLCDIFFDQNFSQGKELSLNIARLLSKVSLDYRCAEKIVKSGHIRGYLHSMVQHRESSAILIRLAYILGNLTTNFEEARQKLCERGSATEKNSFLIITELAVYYLEKDAQGATADSQPAEEQKQRSAGKNKYQEFTTGHLEDALTKVIKLLANLSTEEEVALDAFKEMKELLSNFIGQVCEAVNRRNIEQNEEFILNAISCVTNILYYDTA